jgi:hypothetical protein
MIEASDMITAEDKAKELVKYFTDNIMSFLNDRMKDMNAKMCATKVVDELLHYSKEHGFIGLTEFYEEVKNEIKKL